VFNKNHPIAIVARLRGWTLAEVASEAEISTSALRRAIRGLPVTSSTAYAIARALSLTAAEARAIVVIRHREPS
jgi:lambda repressor-like predicted transcriptional regulator